MMPVRHIETHKGEVVYEEPVTVAKSLKDDTDRTFFKAWEDPNVGAIKTINGSFADVLNSNKPSSKSKFRSLLNSEQVENADVVLPLAIFTAAQQRYANSLKVIKDEDGFFFIKFTSLSGLEQVLEQGPWLIRNIPIILTKWSPNLALTKDKVTKVPVWVKMHKVHVVAILKIIKPNCNTNWNQLCLMHYTIQCVRIWVKGTRFGAPLTLGRKRN
ncbi:retrovirus-related pol polyprotein from transposon TNT 1-94 [Tanacetum coccineum]|uniref:Retrovirus-related pol polyprotein from transposon TNT 1-94 n=1 Tax=Tanacetum coccineum TaxID=301880 RepID=A0ABQ4WBN6_9ASTR